MYFYVNKSQLYKRKKTNVSVKALVSMRMNPAQLMKTCGPVEHWVTSSDLFFS